MAAPSALPRLLASAEALAHEEDGAVAGADWPALATLLARERQIVDGVAAELGLRTASDTETEQARTLTARWERLRDRIEQERARAQEELAALLLAKRRLRSVKNAYKPSPREADFTRLSG